jgi:hypothetical protein
VGGVQVVWAVCGVWVVWGVGCRVWDAGRVGCVGCVGSVGA